MILILLTVAGVVGATLFGSDDDGTDTTRFEVAAPPELTDALVTASPTGVHLPWFVVLAIGLLVVTTLAVLGPRRPDLRVHAAEHRQPDPTGRNAASRPPPTLRSVALDRSRTPTLDRWHSSLNQSTRN